MDKQDTLRAVRATLDTIRVSGRHDLDALLGCIMALDRLIEAGKEEGNGRQTDQ